MEQLTEFLRLTGLDPGLFGVAIIMAVVLRFARGMIHWVGDGWTFGAAMLLAVTGAVLKMSEHESWRITGFNFFGLLACVLLLQYGLGQIAAKWGFLPKDNEWLITKPKQ